ncbi:MAG: hypothetical protein NZL87_07140, partial [Thermomicrobium sp.]|nr:hypothetical protein [Thermomicrobium sp.]
MHEPARYWTTRFSPSSAKTNALVPTVAAVTRLARGDERYPPAFESPARARGSPSGNGITTYFRPPASWVGTPRLYFYETSPSVPQPTWDTSPAMTPHGNG